MMVHNFGSIPIISSLDQANTSKLLFKNPMMRLVFNSSPYLEPAFNTLASSTSSTWIEIVSSAGPLFMGPRGYCGSRSGSYLVPNASFINVSHVKHSFNLRVSRNRWLLKRYVLLEAFEKLEVAFPGIVLTSFYNSDSTWSWEFRG